MLTNHPALIWDAQNRHHPYASSYWNSDLLQPFVQTYDVDENSRHSFLTYQAVYFLASLLAEKLYSRISHVINSDSQFITLSEKDVLHIPVAVSIPEGIFLPIAILATHLANLPFQCLNKSRRLSFSVVMVPLDPTEGTDRLRHMIENSRPSLAFIAADCDESHLRCCISAAPSAISTIGSGQAKIYQSAQTQTVDVREWIRAIVENCNGYCTNNEPLLDTTSFDLLDVFTRSRQTTTEAEFQVQDRISHIVYTSGTTGYPKGCISSIQSLKNYIFSKNATHEITQQSIVLLASALSFDPCLSDILATWSMRATLAVAPREHLRHNLHRTLARFKITHCLCTPTLWSTMAVSGTSQADVPSLKMVALGGEPIPQHLRRLWARQGPEDKVRSLRFCATFGVTEACVYQTIGEIYLREGGFRTGQDVGVAFPGMDVRICKESQQSSMLDVDNVGDAGEVVLYGNQLDALSGYLNSPPQSDCKFVHHNGLHVYRTGDRGFIEPHTKRLYIQGRIQGEEGMIKVNGVRVELGEIEAAIVKETSPTPIVVDCLAVCADTKDATANETVQEVVAYTVLSQSFLREMCVSRDIPDCGVLCTPGPLLVLLRERCQSRARVTPASFVLIPNIPLSPTGKRFRQGLPPVSGVIPLDQIVEVGGICVPSISLRGYGQSGKIVTDVIIDCLNLQRSQEPMLTTKSTFAMLGGDSLAATRVTRALYARHHNVLNSRNIGGQYGTLGGAFDVIHLVRAQSLGEYIDWLDRHGVGAWSEPRNSTSDNLLKKPDEVVKSAEIRKSSHLYDALMQAITSRQSLLSLALLDMGADPHRADHTGRLGKITDRNDRKKVFRTGPMHVACLRGMPLVVKGLLRKGCTFQLPDASGMFPIHLAATGVGHDSNQNNICESEARIECIRLLLDAGVPITIKDGNKQTLLHAAARAGDSIILQFVMGEWRRIVGGDYQRRGSLDWKGKRFDVLFESSSTR